MQGTYKETLRIRSFLDLWLGQAVSQLGDSFYNIVFLFMVMATTKSVALTGFVAAMEWLPFLLVGPYAGVLADRVDRRRIMLTSDLVSAGVLALFALPVLTIGYAPLWTLFVTPLLLSSARVFFMPAKSASIPRLVPTRLLQPANALSATTQNMMPLVSLPLSATVLAALYQLSPQAFLASAVGLNMLSFLGSAWFIRRLPEIRPEVAEEKHPIDDIVAGFRYVRGRHALFVMVVASFFLNLFISPFYIVYLATNAAWFGGMPQTIAIFELCFFVGMAAGGLICGRSTIRHVGVANSLSLFGVGATVVFMAWSTNIWLFCLWNVVAGLALPFAHIPVQTYIQTSTEDAFRGRVNSALNMVSAGVHPIGMFAAGIMVERVGLVASYIIMGGGMGLVALLALADKRYRLETMPAKLLQELPHEEDQRHRAEGGAEDAGNQAPLGVSTE